MRYRLLEAPPALIVAKFLAAHKQRAGRIVKQFIATLTAGPTIAQDDSAGEAPATPPTWAEVQTQRLESVRIFHQNFVLGLIEATRGVASVCKDISKGGSASRVRTRSGDDKTATEIRNDNEGVAVAAYEDLYAMIAIVLPDYTDALVRALGVFFHVYEEAVRSGESGGGRHAESENKHSPIANKDGQNPMGTSIREEHRQRWISFARQVGDSRSVGIFVDIDSYLTLFATGNHGLSIHRPRSR